MVRSGDADGMVSGAMCTTANTIRPALQVGQGTGASRLRARQQDGRGLWAGMGQALEQRSCRETLGAHFLHPAPQPPCACTCCPCPWAAQVLKTPQKTLVSSIFFMCLPDKVSR